MRIEEEERWDDDRSGGSEFEDSKRALSVTPVTSLELTEEKDLPMNVKKKRLSRLPPLEEVEGSMSELERSPPRGSTDSPIDVSSDSDDSPQMHYSDSDLEPEILDSEEHQEEYTHDQNGYTDALEQPLPLEAPTLNLLHKIRQSSKAIIPLPNVVITPQKESQLSFLLDPSSTYSKLHLPMLLLECLDRMLPHDSTQAAFSTSTKNDPARPYTEVVAGPETFRLLLTLDMDDGPSLSFNISINILLSPQKNPFKPKGPMESFEFSLLNLPELCGVLVLLSIIFCELTELSDLELLESVAKEFDSLVPCCLERIEMDLDLCWTCVKAYLVQSIQR